MYVRLYARLLSACCDAGRDDRDKILPGVNGRDHPSNLALEDAFVSLSGFLSGFLLVLVFRECELCVSFWCACVLVCTRDCSVVVATRAETTDTRSSPRAMTEITRES